MPKVQVGIFQPIVDLAGMGKAPVHVEMELNEKATVRDLIGCLKDLCGESFEEVVLDKKRGTPTEYVNVFINGRDVRHLAGLDTKLNDGDTVIFMAPLSGGREY